ncbi:MAG: GGDEF protein [uncultured bacterium (gcode 4)]|uniref:GGDEF protein n=1 Tax=uncultured bacterium (gcode 4) TaxID=1234023 RepID=K2GWQ7_9BACT|nr:MAG: GGDEF protein [uncultured bacterium (gcode 4)]
MEKREEVYTWLNPNSTLKSPTEQRVSRMVEEVLQANFWVSHQDLIEKVSAEISKRLNEKAKHEAFVSNLLNSFTDELVNFQDEDHVIRYCNDAFATFVGFPKEEIIWKKCFEIICSSWCTERCPIESIKRWINKSICVDYDWIHLEKSANIVTDDNGIFIWYVEIYKDRSEIVRQKNLIEEQNKTLTRTNEFLSSALSNSKQWTWEWNIITWEVRADENFYKILWYNNQEVEFNYDFWETILHPDDREIVLKELKKSARKADKSFQFTYRLLNLNWDYVWVTASGKVIELDLRWKPLKAIWTHMDITEITNIKRYLRQNEQKLTTILRSIPDLLIVIDKNWNYKELSGSSRIWPRRVWMNINEIFDQENTTLILEWINRTIETGVNQKIQYSIVENDKVYKYSWNCQTLSSDQVVIITRDVTQDMELHEEVKHMANHDNLTWLLNRFSFNERLRKIINDAAGEDNLAVMFIDLDLFKNVNDSYGHAVWDAVLKEVWHRLLSATRWSDIVSRLGWDEFWIILPTIQKKEDYEIVAQRIIKSLSEPFIIEWKTIQIWSSIWISLYPEHWDDVDSIINHADTAMYKVKKWAKNNYLVYSEEEEK